MELEGKDSCVKVGRGDLVVVVAVVEVVKHVVQIAREDFPV